MLCDALKLSRLKCRKVAFDDGACAEVYMLWGDLKNADVMSADQLHKKVFLRTVKDDMWPDQPPVKGFHTDSDQSATALLRYVNVKRSRVQTLALLYISSSLSALLPFNSECNPPLRRVPWGSLARFWPFLSLIPSAFHLSLCAALRVKVSVLF